jgi:hypothetical protein
VAHLSVPAFLNTIESSGLSTWIRETESPFGFYFILLFHNLGLGAAVGTSVFVSLRLRGVAPDLPLAPLKKFFTILWTGAWISAVSGMFLLIAYPTKALTNPVFYVKLTLVGAGVWIMLRIEKLVFDDASASEEVKLARGKSLTAWSFAVWIAAVSAGRLLAYTFRYLLYGRVG